MAAYMLVNIDSNAWWHQAVTWTNVDLSLIRMRCGIDLGAHEFNP